MFETEALDTIRDVETVLIITDTTWIKLLT